MLVSHHNKVCQCLARFIKWADEILIHGNKNLDKTAAHEVIEALSDGVKVRAIPEVNAHWRRTTHNFQPH